jgi:uncharacterized protein YndB with AHSA1/START domain
MTSKKPDFIYTTYIKSTPEKVWKALTVSEFTKQYWGISNVTDSKKGSEWSHVGESGKAMMMGKILESDPPRHLKFSWYSPDNKDDVSEVTYEIEGLDDMVKLVVIHAGFAPGSEMLKGISDGWPRVLCNLKSYLETGATLNIWAWKGSCSGKAA